MAMPNDVVIGRHMESEANFAFRQAEEGNSEFYKRLGNRPDALHRGTRRGVEPIKLTSTWIKEHILQGGSFDAHFTSDFVRARETAALLDLPQARWELSSFLCERDWGDLVREPPTAERLRFYKETFERQANDPLHWRPEGGHTLAEGAQRIYLFIIERLRSYAGKRVYISSHGDIAWVFRYVFEWLTPEQLRALYFCAGNKINNGTLLHYTRRNPHKEGEIAEHLGWMRMVTPWISKEPTEWREIGRKLWTNEELLASVEDTPRLLDV